MFVRSIILYVFVLFAIRFMGKRQVGEMQPFEFVITLIIADLATIPMSEISIPILHGIVPIFSVVILHYVICLLSRKSMFARYLISGRSSIVMTPDGINYAELKKLNMNLDDLIEALRGCEVFSMDDVAYAIVETNGKLCVIKKSSIEPPTREDMNVKIIPSTLPVNIIMDGKVMVENTSLAKVNDNFLNSCIKKVKAKSAKDIILMTLDNNGMVYIQPKNASAMSYQSDYQGGGDW